MSNDVAIIVEQLEHSPCEPIDPPGLTRRWCCRGCGAAADSLRALLRIRCNAPQSSDQAVMAAIRGAYE